jgi:hypothetical protein
MYKFKTKNANEAGLRIWIAFILGFWLVGIRAELCVLLGALGGLAARQIVCFWQAEKAEPKPAPSEEAAKPADSALAPLGEVFRKPAERFRNIGRRRLPKLPSRKPRKPPRQF